MRKRSVTSMEFMLDSANLAELKHGLEYYPVDGITTNPSILKAELPMNYYEHIKAIKELCGERTLHVQVGSLTCEDMLAEAEKIQAAVGKNVYLKVPVTEEGVKAIRHIKARGGNVTATSIYYPFQGIMAIHAGADYLAPYCNRMANNDIDFYGAISQLRELIDRDGYDAKILAASFKSVQQVTQAIEAGAHSITIQPVLLKTAMHSALVSDAVAAFGRDHERVLAGK